MKTLECSSKGDTRFSAFYAKIKIFGKYDSIENHYQLSKRFGEEIPKTWRDAKGKIPTHLHINGKDIDIEYTVAWYDLLWVAYFKENPYLITVINKYDKFNDTFKGKKSIVCQADSIKKFKDIGREGILEGYKEFIEMIR